MLHLPAIANVSPGWALLGRIKAISAEFRSRAPRPRNGH
jgi:hypothetical protein